MRWFHFILSHSIFISFCAAALCFQSYLLLDIPVDNRVILLIFCSTLCSYNFYWLISKFYFATDKHPARFLKRNFSNVLLFLLAGIAAIVLLYAISDVTEHILISILLTLLYSIPLWPVKAFAPLRTAGFIKTLLLAFTWTYVTVMFPVRISFFNITTDIAILFTARFSFMLMLCIIFDSRDIAVDKMHALRSLATDVSRNNLRTIMWLVFLVYIGSGLLLRFSFSTPPQIIAFFITGIITLFVYQQSLKKQGYIFYYFLVDGLMLFSAVATYVASI
jgi:hypothetical protein